MGQLGSYEQAHGILRTVTTLPNVDFAAWAHFFLGVLRHKQGDKLKAAAQARGQVISGARTQRARWRMHKSRMVGTFRRRCSGLTGLVSARDRRQRKWADACVRSLRGLLPHGIKTACDPCAVGAISWCSARRGISRVGARNESDAWHGEHGTQSMGRDIRQRCRKAH